ncbi:hypothetical protein HPB50_012029 [Hyalomma asiaticum]|uniref:Uncharacterized protein n=1 Tax=Hyalomma asiaticum TaxID=266040 RepID=A0ACB7T1L1_HYAAI|nr:hypothetical protein HPB50_012029 [Hyalomma asiaticum]
MSDSRMDEDAPDVDKENDEDLGWQVVTGRRSHSGKNSDAANETLGNSQAPGRDAATGHGMGRATTTGTIKNRIVKASRMPQLPEEHRKIIIRPRGGLNMSKVCTTVIGPAVIEASGLTAEQANEDVVCPNFTQNIVVVSTPKPDHAARVPAETPHLAPKLQQVPRGRSRSRSRARSRRRSLLRGRSRSQSRGAQMRLEDGTPGAKPTAGIAWADKVKGTVRAAGSTGTPVVTESNDARIEQLIREVNFLRKANEDLTKQVIELKKRAQPSPASVAVAKPLTQSNKPSDELKEVIREIRETTEKTNFKVDKLWKWRITAEQRFKKLETISDDDDESMPSDLESLQLLKSGSRSFSCNLGDSAQHGGKPNDETEACAAAATAGSLQPRGSPTGGSRSSPPAPRRAGRDSFLSDEVDEVSQLREDNERLRKEHSRVAEQQVRIVASLLDDLRFLRDELTRRIAPKLASPPSPAKSPTTVQCDFSVKPDTPVTSDTETLPPFTPPPGFQRDWKLRVVDRAETSSANVTETSPEVIPLDDIDASVIIETE